MTTLVIIESPFAGRTDGEVEENIAYARLALADCLLRGEAPIASHLLYTQVLTDTVLEEREIGITAGLAWYATGAKAVVYTDRGVSAGMERGVDQALGFGCAVEYRTIGRRGADHHQLANDAQVALSERELAECEGAP